VQSATSPPPSLLVILVPESRASTLWPRVLVVRVVEPLVSLPLVLLAVSLAAELPVPYFASLQTHQYRRRPLLQLARSASRARDREACHARYELPAVNVKSLASSA